MQSDDETTATQLQHVLNQSGFNISLATIKRCRKELGWTFQGSRYCREPNKFKRLEFAQKCVADKETFCDVIWSDETSVQLECHRRHSFRKQGQAPRLKPRPKHPVKVHVWAAISKRGATKVSIFEGKMNAEFYIEILTRYLRPFIAEKFPTSHRCMQDNDPKHTSQRARVFYAANGINWWKTPPESPDLNPIENLWHELKEYLRREVKPLHKQQLVDGIKQFWATVDVVKCCRYIKHLDKVVPKVIELLGTIDMCMCVSLSSFNPTSYIFKPTYASHFVKLASCDQVFITK